MAKPKKVIDREVLDYMDMFQWAFNCARPHLDRMQELQKMYDNVLDPSSMPTMSEIPIPVVFSMVEKALPTVMDYLFPKDKFIRLNPIGMSIPMEKIEKVEWAVQHMVTNRVKLQNHAIETLKDCMKFGVGYGEIVNVAITPPSAFITGIVDEESGVVRRSRVIQKGKKKQAIRYRYVGPGEIVVTPDGTEFNGQNRVSTAFHIDYYSEDRFRKLFEDGDGTEAQCKGDVEAIIKTSKSEGYTGAVPFQHVIAKLAGLKLSKFNQSTLNARMPVIIPVIKIYEEDRHLWIANGEDKILDNQSDVEIMRTPLVKASAWPEGRRWYPMSPVEASQKMAVGVNIWFNAIFDLLTQTLRPMMVYDKNKFANGEPERGPNGVVGASGPVTESIKYLENPAMPPEIFRVGDMMRAMYAETVGQNPALENAQPGLLRGGAFAFESLLQTTTGRERLVGAVLETRWLEDTIEQILINMQLNVDDGDLVYEVRDYEPMTGKEYITSHTVTPDELVNGFEVELSLKEKHKATAANFSARQADLINGLNSEFTDKYEVWKDYYGNEDRARRLLKPREVIQQIESDNREARLTSVANGIAEKQAQQAAPSTQGEQALAGAGAAALGGEA